MSTQTTAGVVLEFTLQDRLRKAREHAGLDQQQLADRMGVSRGTVGNSEGGHVKVRPITIRAWAMATGVDPHWLETGEVPISPDDGGAVTVLSRTSLRLLQAA